MSIYHCSIKIISRSGGRSAVASAAYRSGEKLYNDETGIIHDFTKKGGVIINEIMLPANAPERYEEREILWNEVQKIEKRSDAQFAREVEVALPSEMSRTEQIECVRNYIQNNFVDKGMIADWALHDKEDGNPHAHIMLTMRGLDEHEKWLQKQKTVFANSKDEEGRAIYNPELPVYDPKDRENTSKYRIPVFDENGEQKTRVRKGKGTEYLWEKISIPLNDWNDHSQAELWRSSWADHCNKYLDKEHQIDHRSYERQGIDKEPTIHEGVTARQIEVEGKVADRCQINRDIKERNSIREQMKKLAMEITEIITEKARSIYGR
ncbi:MAG TPA: MobQ family relaxase, partial [Lachnospiraceae bacterium]|nr:MobQ family relaxase [Lachnospiraceae bacterium]